MWNRVQDLKLQDDRGETLIEVMASILIATLSVALLFTCIMASSRIEDTDLKLGVEHYDALSEADAQFVSTPDPSSTDPVPTVPVVTVTVSRKSPDGSSVEASAAPSVEIYGGEGMYSYKEKQP